jgi:hypothetical protein
MIDYVEALFAFGVIGGCEIDEVDEAAFRIVAQEGQHGVDGGGFDMQCQFAIGDG